MFGSSKQSLGLEKPQSYRSRSTRTCSGTRLATSSPTMGMIPEHSSTTWATRISCTLFDTPKWLLIGLKTSGRTKTGGIGDDAEGSERRRWLNIILGTPMLEIPNWSRVSDITRHNSDFSCDRT